MKKIWLTLILLVSLIALAGCNSSSNDSSGDDSSSVKYETRVIEHAMGSTEVPVSPEKIVVLNGDALEALISLGIKPIGATQAMGDRIWYPHLEEHMDGVTNVGTMTEPDLEAIMSLEPDLIIGTKSRTEESYDFLSEIAPTVFNEDHRNGLWKEDFLLYADSVGKLDEGESVLQDWEERAKHLSEKLDKSDKLSYEVGVLRFTAGQGRYFYNNSYSGSILKELGFARPANHASDDKWTENITQERIPEMDADILFYFVLDEGDGEGTKFADEWMSTQLFQDLRASQSDSVYEVSDAYWNMTYGILSADYVIEDIERIILAN